MEEYKKDDRGRSKAKRLTETDSNTKVDSSSWTSSEALNADIKTGARPLVKRLYKKGGKVVGKHEGKDAVKHAGRMPRKAGGRTTEEPNRAKRYLTPDNLINRDVRMANDEREGIKHIGAFKKGGKAKYGKGGRMPLEGHSYHKKTDAELRYISKDAAEAARAMKGMDSKAEGKYLDQVNDAQTILGHRQRTGNGPESGMNKGGPAKKFGGGPLGSNPVSQQNQMMGQAAGMRKAGGKVNRKLGGGIEDEYRPTTRDPNYKGASYNDEDKEKIANVAKYGSMKGNPTASPDYPNARKRGGEAKHSDAAQDKKLMHKVLKPNAFMAKGGEIMHHEDCTCKMCGGGRTMKYAGGGVFSGDSKTKIPGVVGGRKARAEGGGLYANIHAKQERIAHGSKEHMRKPGSKGAPTSDAFKQSARTAKASGGSIRDQFNVEFAKQRAQGAKTFEFQGKTYNTELKAPSVPMPPVRPSQPMAQPSGNRAPEYGYTPPATHPEYGLFMGKQGEPAITFQREMPGAAPVTQAPDGGRFGVHPRPAPSPAPISEQDPRMGRGMPSHTEYGLFGGRPGNANDAAINFSREVPDYPASSFVARKSGGRTKSKTNINIIIAAGKGREPQGMMGGAPMPDAPVSPRTPPAGAGMPPQGMPPMPPAGPQGGPPMPPQGMPMPRKAGGRTKYPIDTGSGGGNARLEKIPAYGLKPSKRK